jgi:membrane associated rhomboid family serine protease
MQVDPTSEAALEKATMHRVTLRLVPFLMACYFFALLDRVNVGFAALHMNKVLGLSPAVFGLGGSLFFVAYFRQRRRGGPVLHVVRTERP